MSAWDDLSDLSGQSAPEALPEANADLREQRDYMARPGTPSPQEIRATNEPPQRMSAGQFAARSAPPIHIPNLPTPGTTWGSLSNIDPDPRPAAGETYADTADRMAQVQRAQQQQADRQYRDEMAGFRARGTPVIPGLGPVTDQTGSPLTQKLRGGNIAYDSQGNPVDYSQRDAIGSPILRDPYANVPVTTDPQTGDMYRQHPQLGWRWVGKDDQVAQDAASDRQNKLDTAASSALAGTESQTAKLARDATAKAKLSTKTTAKTLSGLGVPLTDDSGQPIDLTQADPDELKAHIEDTFNQRYATPEANDTHFFGGGYTADALTLRHQLDQDKLKAMQAVDSHFTTLQHASDAQDSLDAIQQQRQQLASGKLDAVNRKRVAAGFDPVQPANALGVAGPSGEAAIPGIDSAAPQQQPTIPGVAKGDPVGPGIQNTLERTALEGAHGFDKAIEGLSRFVGLTGFADFLKNRTEQQEAALRGESGTQLGHQLAAPSATGKVISGVAGGLISQAPGIALGGIPGLIAVGTQAMGNASAQAHDDAKAQGATDDDASKAAGIAALKTLPSTALYASTGGVTSALLKNVLPLAASPLARAAASLVTGTAANIVAGATGKAVTGENPTPTLDDVVNSVVFAAHGASGEHQTGKDLATARSIINGTHPEVAVMDGIAEGKVPQATPEQQASAAQYSNALRAVAAKYIEKAGYQAPEAERPADVQVPAEKQAQAREVTPETSVQPPAAPEQPAAVSGKTGATIPGLEPDAARTPETAPSKEPVAPSIPTDAAPAPVDPAIELSAREKELQALPDTAPPWKRDLIAGRIRELRAQTEQPSTPTTNTAPAPQTQAQETPPAAEPPTPSIPESTAKEGAVSQPESAPAVPEVKAESEQPTWSQVEGGGEPATPGLKEPTKPYSAVMTQEHAPSTPEQQSEVAQRLAHPEAKEVLDRLKKLRGVTIADSPTGAVMSTNPDNGHVTVNTRALGHALDHLQGDKAKQDYVTSALDEELNHQAAIIAVPHKEAAAIGVNLSPEERSALEGLYGAKMPDHVAGYEAIRAFMQGAKGNPTEAFHLFTEKAKKDSAFRSAIEKALKFIREIASKIKSGELKNRLSEAIKKVQAVLDGLEEKPAEVEKPVPKVEPKEPVKMAKAKEPSKPNLTTPVQTSDVKPAAEKGALSYGAKVRLGKSPQLNTILEELPTAKGDLPDERFFRVKNDRTGETQTVESRDMKPVNERSAEEKKRAKEVSDKLNDVLDQKLRSAKMDPSSFPDVKSKRAALRRAESKLSASSPMTADHDNQSRWMTREAQARGFDSVGELLDKSPDSFTKLAKQWRAFHHRQGGNYVQDGEARAINTKLYGPTNPAGTSQNTLGDAEAFLRGKDGAGEAFEGGSRKDQRAQLVQWAKDRGLLISKAPFRIGGPSDVGQSEHHVFEVGNRWVKLTKGTGEGFGYATKNGAMKSGSALDYITRLNLANEVFGDDVRLHAVWQDKRGNVSLVTSQPDVAGTKLSQPEIQKHMEEAGFQSLGDSRYYRYRDNLLVSDLHPENAVEHQGALVPFDAHVSNPSDADKAAVFAQAKQPLATSSPEQPPGIIDREQSLRNAYDKIVADKARNPWGFPDVHISDVIKEAGLPLDEGKKLIRSLRGKGVQIASGDWSMANDEQKAAGIESGDSRGGKDLLMRFEPKEELAIPSGTPEEAPKPAGAPAVRPEGQQGLNAPGETLGEDSERPEDGKTASERLMRQADEAGISYSTETLKGMIRGDLKVMEMMRAKIREAGKTPLGASSPSWDKVNSTVSKLKDASGFTSVVDDVQKALSPDSRLTPKEREEFLKSGDPNAIGDARKTSIFLDGVTAAMDRRKKQWEDALKGAKALVDKLPEKQQKELMLRMDEGTPLKPGPYRDAMEAILKEDAKKVDEAKAWFDSHGQSHWANYENYLKNVVPRQFEDPDMANKVMDGYLRARKMQGGTGWLKHRQDVTMREIMDYAEQQGTPLKPKHTNVVDAIMDRWMQQERYFGAHDMISKMESHGIGHWEPTDYEGVAGEKQVNNVIGQRVVEVPKEGHEDDETTRQKQYFWAQEPAAQIINNYLSRGLRSDRKWVENYFTAANALNSAQLGLSFFHGGFVTMEGMVSSFSLGIQKVLSGDMSGLKDMALAPFSTWHDWKLGGKIRDEMLNPGKYGQQMQSVVNSMVEGGFRDGLDSFYQDNHISKMLSAFRDKRYAPALLRAPMALIEAAAKPIMEHFVPRMKAAAVYKLAEMHLKQNPNITPMEMRRRLQEDVRSGNNRFGQMTYDNLHLHKIVKDLLMMATRSLGWNWGTFSEIGGGLHDWAKFIPQAGKAAFGKGETPRVTNKMAYTLGLPMLVGALGAALSAMFGQKIKDPKDLYFVKTGDLDERGNPIRVSLPSYMKDVFHAGNDPKSTITNKLHPLLSMIGDMLRNKDFYGVEIRHAGDPVMKQILQELGYVGKQFVPFTARNTTALRDAKAPIGLQVAGLVGVTKAPASVNKSSAQALADQINSDSRPTAARTSEQADASKLRGRLTGMLRAGNGQSELSTALRNGDITPAQARAIQHAATMTTLQASVSHLGLNDAERVYEKATPEEKRQLDPVMVAKRGRATPQHKVAAPMSAWARLKAAA